MIDYKDYNDYELVSLAQELNEDAIKIIYQKYKPIMLQKSLKYSFYLKNKGYDLEDLMQECYIVLDDTIKNFNQEKETIFYTYFLTCLDRHLVSQFRKSANSKNKFLNESISLEDKTDDDIEIIDFIKDNTNNPELNLETKEQYSSLCNRIIEKLTNLEECVFLLKIQNFNYHEIASILDKDIKSIDNAIQRIKIKIKLLI